MNQARVEQVGAPQEVYDRPASPFVYQFLGNVNVLPDSALGAGRPAGGPPAGLRANGHIYVRPHDIEVGRHMTGAPGIPAIIRYIHTAGPRPASAWSRSSRASRSRPRFPALCWNEPVGFPRPFFDAAIRHIEAAGGEAAKPG